MVGGEFLYHIRTRSRKSVVICEKLTNFVVLWVFIPSATTYLMKVFSLLSLTRNLTVSTKDEDTTTLISCIAMWLYAFGVPTPYYSSVGSCNRLFVLGFVRASCQINGSQLHTFLFLIIHHRGAYGFEQEFIINSKHKCV